MHFHIVTPSYNQLEFLKRNIASVADQVVGSIRIHHHIQDACSSDGTPEWLKEYVAETQSIANYQLTFSSESDQGMYDAINRGWLLADDDIDVIAHLNCDEQYLPEALEIIATFFFNHRTADVVLADMIVVDNDGTYICHRRSLKPNALLSRICCVGMTTTTFQRASMVRDRKVLFDTSWRNIGDMVWYNTLHTAGARFAVCNELVSLFTDTGDNLNLTEEAIRERKRYAKEYLWGLRWPTRMMSKMYSLFRYLKDFFLTAPSHYALYWRFLDKREIRKVENTTPLWHRKGPAQLQ